MNKKEKAFQSGVISKREGKEKKDNPFTFVAPYFDGESNTLAKELGEQWDEGYMWENVNGGD